MCGGSILSCCPRNPHRHERALKEEEVEEHRKVNEVWRRNPKILAIFAIFSKNNAFLRHILIQIYT